MQNNKPTIKSVTREEFEALCKENPKVKVRSFQAGGEPSYYVSMDSHGCVYDLEREFRASF